MIDYSVNPLAHSFSVPVIIKKNKTANDQTLLVTGNINGYQCVYIHQGALKGVVR